MSSGKLRCVVWSTFPDVSKDITSVPSMLVSSSLTFLCLLHPDHEGTANLPNAAKSSRFFYRCPEHRYCHGTSRRSSCCAQCSDAVFKQRHIPQDLQLLQHPCEGLRSQNLCSPNPRRLTSDNVHNTRHNISCK